MSAGALAGAEADLYFIAEARAVVDLLLDDVTELRPQLARTPTPRRRAWGDRLHPGAERTPDVHRDTRFSLSARDIEGADKNGWIRTTARPPQMGRIGQLPARLVQEDT